MKSGVKMTKDRVDVILKGISVAPDYDVLVGIPSEKSTRAGSDAGSMSNAALGYIHENGAPEANLPPRPFLLPGIRASSGRFSSHLKKAVTALMGGENTKAEQHLNAAGLMAVNAVRRQINQGIGFAPLAASTLAARRRRGRTGEKPLIDTGQLRNSITYAVRKTK